MSLTPRSQLAVGICTNAYQPDLALWSSTMERVGRPSGFWLQVGDVDLGYHLHLDEGVELT